jgi:Na+/proline symporter
VGGFDYVQSALAPGYMTPMGDLPPWLVFVYASTGLVVFIEPAFYQRIFAARSAAAVRNALLFGILLWAAYDWCTTAAGMMAAAAVARGILPEVSPDLALLSVVVYALPAGLTGLFLAGVLAAEMSTIDSYCLVAGGNVAYDFYRPFVRPRASERELLRVARFGVALSWLAGFAVAFLFDRLLALWVFTASLLTSTLLVPMMAALFGRGPKTAASGLLSCTLGLASCLAYYALVQSLGAYDDDLGSYVWRCAIGTRTYDLWQEYALLVSLPVSAAGFWFGSLIGVRRPT